MSTPFFRRIPTQSPENAVGALTSSPANTSVSDRHRGASPSPSSYQPGHHLCETSSSSDHQPGAAHDMLQSTQYVRAQAVPEEKRLAFLHDGADPSKLLVVSLGSNSVIVCRCGGDVPPPCHHHALVFYRDALWLFGGARHHRSTRNDISASPLQMSETPFLMYSLDLVTNVWTDVWKTDGRRAQSVSRGYDPLSGGRWPQATAADREEKDRQRYQDQLAILLGTERCRHTCCLVPIGDNDAEVLLYGGQIESANVGDCRTMIDSGFYNVFAFRFSTMSWRVVSRGQPICFGHSASVIYANVHDDDSNGNESKRSEGSHYTDWQGHKRHIDSAMEISTAFAQHPLMVLCGGAELRVDAPPPQHYQQNDQQDAESSEQGSPTRAVTSLLPEVEFSSAIWFFDCRTYTWVTQKCSSRYLCASAATDRRVPAARTEHHACVIQHLNILVIYGGIGIVERRYERAASPINSSKTTYTNTTSERLKARDTPGVKSSAGDDCGFAPSPLYDCWIFDFHADRWYQLEFFTEVWSGNSLPLLFPLTMSPVGTPVNTRELLGAPASPMGVRPTKQNVVPSTVIPDRRDIQYSFSSHQYKDQMRELHTYLLGTCDLQSVFSLRLDTLWIARRDRQFTKPIGEFERYSLGWRSSHSGDDKRHFSSINKPEDEGSSSVSTSKCFIFAEWSKEKTKLGYIMRSGAPSSPRQARRSYEPVRDSGVSINSEGVDTSSKTVSKRDIITGNNSNNNNNDTSSSSVLITPPVVHEGTKRSDDRLSFLLKESLQWANATEPMEEDIPKKSFTSPEHRHHVSSTLSSSSAVQAVDDELEKYRKLMARVEEMQLNKLKSSDALPPVAVHGIADIARSTMSLIATTSSSEKRRAVRSGLYPTAK